MAKFEIKDVKAEAVPGIKQIEVETVNVATNMDRSEFFLFVSKIFDSVRDTENHYYSTYRKYCDKSDNATDDKELKDSKWQENFYHEKWAEMSDLETLFKNWLDAHEDWKGEEE